jgi:penicillin G amidase
MLRSSHRFALSFLTLAPLVLAAGCGSDEPDVSRKSNDPGPFGTRVAVTDTRQISGLKGSANAVRDKYGWMHIYARNAEDLFRVEGWMMAADRGGQLEIARRLATGRLAEVFGAADPGQIDSDITMRTIGLARTAQKIYDSLDPKSDTKKYLDAFADGVSQWNAAYRAGEVHPPQELAGLGPEFFTDWSPVDSLAMARLQTWSLSYDADSDISATEKVEKIRSVFNPSAADPDNQKRAGFLVDAYRFDPIVDVHPLDDFPDDPLGAYRIPGPGHSAKAPSEIGPFSPFAKKPQKMNVNVALARLAASRPFVEAVQRARDFVGGDEFYGSNNWAVAGSQTATGNAMVASDPHLGLSSPMVFWPTHLVVQADDKKPPELELSGVAFPGIPGVVLGANRTMAWGATTAGYDVTDVWKETVTGDGSGVTFKGQPVAFEKISETIKIAGSADYTWDILVVPHHGPLVPEIDSNHQVAPASGAAMSVHWTGHDASGEAEAVLALAKAKNVDEARVALQPFKTGAQNWMFADQSGDVFLFSQANIPYRDKKAYTWDPATFSGTLPCFVLDGASGDMEWTGKYLEEQYVPKLKTPQKGWIASANTDQIGSTSDDDPSNETLPNGQPFYIGCDFAEGFRLGRIEERLKGAVGAMTLDEMASIQGDHTSALGSRLGKYLVGVLQAAEEEKSSAGSHADLTALVADPRYAAANVADVLDALGKWETDSSYLAAAGVNLDDNSLNVDPKEATAAKATVIFNAWLIRSIGHALRDETEAAGIGDLGSTNMVKGFVRMLEQDPTQLATYDSSTGESALWDDISTKGAIETKDQVLLMGFLDAIDDLTKAFGADRTSWRWGALHHITFGGLNPLWLVNNPPLGDALFPKGFPRPGDQWGVDAANYGVSKSPSSPLDFNYGSGPVQRFVAELTPQGPKIKNALPGGTVLSTTSPFFANEAEMWRRNQNHDVPFEIDDVVAAAADPGGEHVLFKP